MKDSDPNIETEELSTSPSLNNTLTKPSTDEGIKEEKNKSQKPVYTKLNYDGLNDDEITILKRQIETPEPSVSYFTLFSFASPFDLLLLFIACISAIVSGAAMPLFTLIFGNLTQIFSDFIVNGSSPDEFQRSVDHNTLYFLYLGIGMGITTYIHTFLNADRGEVIAARFRKRYLKAVLRQNIGYFDHIGAGEVTSRVTSDITLIQDGISEKIGVTFSGFASFISAFVISFIKSWKLTLILLSCIVVMLSNIGIATYFLVKCINQTTAVIGEASTVAEDVLSSIRNTVAFGVQQRLANKFDAKLEIAEMYGIRKGFIVATMVSVIWFVAYTTYSLAFWEGSRLINSGEIGIGALMTTVTSVMIGAFALANVAPGFEAMGGSVGAAYKIFEAINRVPVIDSERDDGEQPNELVGRIEFQNVKFAYPSRPNVPVLEDFNLVIEPGQTVALVGASGSGKSTIIGLLERFYEPIGGTITIDGHNLESLNVKWLRRQLSLVSQEPVLFSCSIYKNIGYGLIGTPYENADEETKSEMIRQACEEANAWEFIKNLTDGLDTEVGERGFLLSGGQKQRIAIARAIVSQPKFLLLDEATSALDTKSEGIVQEALDRALQSRTTIIIAHRLSTIRDADKIVVMSNGKIIETGTHNDLLSRQGAYHLLVQAQNIRATNEKDHLALSDEGSKEQKELYKVDTRATRGSISSLVIKDLERDSYYEPKVITRSTFTLVKSLLLFAREHLNLMYLGAVLSLASGAGYPIMSFILGKCINAMMVPPSEYSKMRSDINLLSGMFFLLGCCELIIYFCVQYILDKHSELLVFKMRSQVFRHFLRMDISFFDNEKHSAGALISSINKDGQSIEGLGGSTLGQILNSSAVLLGGLIMAIVINWRLGLVISSCMPILVGCGFLRISVIAKLEERARTAYESSGNYACEGISAIRTVASLAREAELLDTYNKKVKDQVHRSRLPLMRSGIMYGLSQGLAPLVMGLGFWYGSTLIRKGQSNQYQFFTAFTAVIFGAQSAGQMFSYAPSMGKARQAAQSFLQILDIRPEIDSLSTEGQTIENVQGELEFRDVHFRYPTRRNVPVLRGTNFTVKPGQFVALVGPSGCGKSTSISLIEQFYRPLAGQILLDGVDITSLNVSNYRRNIGLVQQEPVLYQGTIRENILMGLGDSDADTIPEEVLFSAARKANIHNFIMSLPDRYETLCGSKGVLLSGGQKQRIAIARALIRDPKVLLLDEATSALDSESEKVVQAALDAAAAGRTTIAVAHRLSTIQNADKICVFDKGRIVEEGTHDQLLQKGGIYSTLVQMQALEGN